MTRSESYTRPAALCLVIVTVSLLGWLFETVFVALTLGYIDNRNMLLPFLLGYGLALAGIYAALGTPTAPRFFGISLRRGRVWVGILAYFLEVFFFISLGEALLGLLVETFLHITWWDYSSIPLHITKFTSVPTSLAFTALVMAFMHFAFDRLLAVFSRMNRRVLIPLAAILMLALTLDFIASGVQMLLTRDFVRYWRIVLWA